MPIAAYFHPKGMTLETYYEIHRRLSSAGAGLAEEPGRLHHSCFGADGDLMVYDIWESPEAFEAFGARLMPILGELGVEVGPPDVMPVHMVNQVAREGSVPE
ncbi:MAG TPA: hypothetical protein VGS21_09870 [Acidimicrobiales bacterium]|nr:hypothetical protein [Acidimicrobiales bacterium]